MNSFTITNRTIKFFVCACISICGIGVYFASTYLSHKLSTSMQNKFINFVFDSVSAGPLTFARLHSSYISTEQLNILMQSSAIKERGVLSVSILSGEDKKIEYASWNNNFEPKDPKCIKQNQKEYRFKDSLAPYYILLNFDNCKILPEQTEIKNISISIIFLLLIISLILFNLSYWPIYSSLNNAELILSGEVQLNKLDNMKYLPVRKLVEIALKFKKIESEEALFILTQQVAHDIRSPLSALSMVTATLKDIPEDKRIIIRNATQRINDIANDLLSKGKPVEPNKILNMKSSIHVEPTKTLSVQFLPVLVDLLVSEKRMQFMKHNNLEISTELNDGFGSFALVDDQMLKRVISNLINNSVESFDVNQLNLDRKNKVVVSVKKNSQQQVIISVRDNGRGIPESILSKLGSEQLSYGKEQSTESGNGLGLYHAKKAIESLKGKIQIESHLSYGTTISIILPLSEAPNWFAKEINLNHKSILISLDDDTSIHQIWAGRLQSLGLDQKIQHLRFQSYELFENYINQNIDQLTKILLLIDYELLNQNKTGLDVIEDLVLEKNAILVTSRYEEHQIQERADKIKLKILPKILSGFVPIVFEQNNQISETVTKVYDWILLDDDELVHMSWQFKAKEKNKTLLSFKTVDELNNQKNQINKSCHFYIDAHLNNGINGGDVALKLYNEGFLNIYMASGYEASNFSHLKFLKGVQGKEPPDT